MFTTHTKQSDEKRLAMPNHARSQTAVPRAHLADVCVELHDLLERYAPAWYTQDLHEKAKSALRLQPAELADVVTELCNLLKAYAPLWYTHEQHERVESALGLLKEKLRS